MVKQMLPLGYVIDSKHDIRSLCNNKIVKVKVGQIFKESFGVVFWVPSSFLRRLHFRFV